MIRRGMWSVRFSLMLLMLAVMWALCGAPLTGAEFAALPSNLAYTLGLLPGRMLRMAALCLA